jgi:hypothetical protein
MFLLNAQSKKEYFDLIRKVSEGNLSKIKLFSIELILELRIVSPLESS